MKTQEDPRRSWLVSSVKYLNLNKEPEHDVSWGSDEMKPWARRPFLVKRIEYQREQEVRFVTFSEEMRSGILLKGLNPNDWIEEIVFWPGFPRSEAEALISAIRKVSPEVSNRTRPSKLFLRDPASRISPEVEDELDDLVADSCRQAAEYLPGFMRLP